MDNGKIEKIIDKYPKDPSSLIQVLIDIQSELRWLPKAALNMVSKKLNVPMNRIQHIITFYKAFSIVPKGRHEVHVCTGTACHVRGATRVLNAVEAHTGINPGETDQELKFSLETVSCVGCCALGPVVVIDGEYHGNMAVAETEEVLKNYE
ncbi:MAG: NAD(P)H-dependent oxidoreductase subunit E [Deltaproteobacteria bacterium]|nr:NAD(P)H-dependent oxidoreductase subunit E [Deltaproteobacteria bacterium]